MAERKRAEKADPEPAASATPTSPYPAEAPPDGVQTRGASNQTGTLPHNATAGVSRAAAYFELIAGESNKGDADLSKIGRWARDGLDDVSRFAPDALRQPARDEVGR